MAFHINDACWNHYEHDSLFDLMDEHVFLFPGFSRPKIPYVPDYRPNARAGTPYTDSFGCLWRTAEDGIAGVIVGHPLADWESYASYCFPDPDISNGTGPFDCAVEEAHINTARENGEALYGGLRHGHTFLQLCALRGYENLVLDMAEELPLLDGLIERLEEFNLSIIRHYAKIRCDVIGYPEDLGMQIGPMLSKGSFQRYVKPSYDRLIRAGKESGALIHMHSDGDVRMLADELVSCGVDVLNIQDQVNGVDWITSRFAGKVCIDIDIDRQHITRSGTQAEIDALIREPVEKIGSKAGGLMMTYGLYPGIPLENVEALMDAMEKYAFFYS